MFDFSIIGGGIVGLSTAWQLKRRRPDADIVVLEKEPDVARHQTGRNSGVIHAGVYYEPGSLKARFCRAGVRATTEFCEAHGIDYLQCGKLIVATNAGEQRRLLALHDRARANGLDATLLDASELAAAEPNIVGMSAIRVTDSGIVDYARVARAMAKALKDDGGQLWCDAEVVAIREGRDATRLKLAHGADIETRFLIVCGGLQSDRLARLQGLGLDTRIVPYRGEYYRLPAAKNDIVSHLIYPVPDPDLPFLGVHLTPMIDGTVTVGPSALQGWKREGYGRINVDLRDVWDMLSFPGFWRVSARFLGAGLQEIRTALSKRAYLSLVHKYCPSLSLDDLEPHPAGVRAMAVSRDGRLIDDFRFAESARSLHVCNAPSPAATSAIPIGDHICNRIDERLAHA